MTINTVDIKEKTVFHIFSTMNEWIDMMIEVFPGDYEKAKSIANQALENWYDIENDDITVFEFVAKKLNDNNIDASIYAYNE